MRLVFTSVRGGVVSIGGSSKVDTIKVHGEGELAAEDASGMVVVEVSCGDPSLLHPNRRHGITNSLRYSGDGSTVEFEGTNLMVLRVIKHHIAAVGKNRLDTARLGNEVCSAAPETGKNEQQFLGFSTVGEQTGDVLWLDYI